MDKKTMKDIKRLSRSITDIISNSVRVTAYVGLLKLLYKQKIKPSTAILFIAAYNLNDKDTNEDIYNAFKDGLKKMFEIEEETKTKEEKCMGFDIK